MSLTHVSFVPIKVANHGLSSFELSKSMMKVRNVTLLPSLYSDPITSMPVTMMATPMLVVCTNTRLTASIYQNQPLSNFQKLVVLTKPTRMSYLWERFDVNYCIILSVIPSYYAVF